MRSPDDSSSLDEEPLVVGGPTYSCFTGAAAAGVALGGPATGSSVRGSMPLAGGRRGVVGAIVGAEDGCAGGVLAGRGVVGATGGAGSGAKCRDAAGARALTKSSMRRCGFFERTLRNLLIMASTRSAENPFVSTRNARKPS